MKKPILFLIFNRPDTTKKVFEAIGKYKPKELYIAADGPRKDKGGEKELCEETRKITENIDWDCEVKTLFRDENLGCRDAVSSAIDWFFENVEDGIILEDDCLPNQAFFRFCEELLDRYRDNEKIMHVSGNNFQLGKKVTDYNYYFSNLNHVWGWATWRNRWQKYNKKMSGLEKFINEDIKKILKYNKMIKQWTENFKKVKNGILDTWDYQWTFSIWSNNGISLLPSKNLVQNIGFDNRSTHTIYKPQYIDKFNAEAKAQDNFKVNRHPEKIKVNLEADQRYYRKIRDSLYYRIIRYIKKKIK
jgi:hypothetical protein